VTDKVEQVTISKVGTGPVTGGTPSSKGLPPSLLRLAVRRVQIICGVILILMFIGWFITNLLEGQLGHEFQRAGEWGPAAFIIATSFAMLAVARYGRIPPTKVLAIALVYEVAISWGIAFSEYYDTFQNIPASLMESDLVGLTTVSLWMMFFTVMLPAPPGRALIALLLSAISVPVVYLLEVRAGRAPYLNAGAIWMIFAGPHFVAVGVAYVSARAIYRLGRDVKRAQEMGSYRLVERLGSGGMGEVWRARHRMLVRPAAVKLIHADALGVDSTDAKVLISRFEREAQVTASLQSPHTVELYDFGTTEDGTFYYVMELLEGIDLERLIHRFGPLPPERAVHIVRQVCSSLGEAHRHGLVHRDVKPANVYLCQRAFENDFVKVLDFGLVKRHTVLPTDDDLQLSQTGTILGTPSYMAPEIARGEGPVDGRSDLYAVGCLAYWLLTGRLVFDERTYPAMLMAHLSQRPQRPSEKTDQSIPPSLDAIVMSCLEKEPQDRIPSAAELIARLDGVEFERPWTNERAEQWWNEHGGDNAGAGSAAIGDPH
jgi:tRNA A-37 threonylcarbamoyl transferase component Bud32/uncharacterized protein (DUF486 family)